MMLLKCCTQYVSKFLKLSSDRPQDWKRSVFIPFLRIGNAKECSNYHTIVLISHASKIRLNSFKLGFNSMWIEKFQMVKLDLEKTEEPEIKLPASVGSWRKQRSSRKNICFIDYVKTFDCMDHNKLWKILKHMGVPDHLSLEKPICRSRSNS